MEDLVIIVLANLLILYLLFYSKVYINLKYKCGGANDYIAIDVYSFRKILSYSMQVPVIEIGDIKKLFWLTSKIKAGDSQDQTHIKREQRFIKKTVKFYMLHPKRLRRIVRLIRYYTRLYCLVTNKITKSLHCDHLQWTTVYGAEDAELTGIGTGVIWTTKALLITRLENHVIFTKRPVINVKPIFGYNSFKVDFQCIFSVRLGNVINAVKILYKIKR